jgi:predicted nucleotidyltransferase
MSEEAKLLEKIKEITRREQPTAKLYLYGSRANGTAKADSDWDLLILLDVDKVSLAMERSITYALYDLEFDTGEVISPMIYSEKEWNSKYKVTPLYKNIMSAHLAL